MIKIYIINDEPDDDIEPPPVGPMHWIPIGDWVNHVAEDWCPCKPVYDKDLDEYLHPAVDGRLAYEKKGWLLD